MTEQEVIEVELRLERGDCRADDMRRLIQAVRGLRDKLEGIGAVLANAIKKRPAD